MSPLLSKSVACILREISKGSRRAEAMPKDEQSRRALAYCRRNRLATPEPRQGPKSPMPKRRRKPVRQLRRGDFLAIGDCSAEVLNVFEGIFECQSGVHVRVGGGVRSYQFNAVVEVFDGPVRQAERWDEWVISDHGRNWLDEHEPESGKPARPRTKGTVNQRMAEMIQEEPGRLSWPASEWAAQLGCTDAAVKQTATWKKTIRGARALQEVKQATRRR